MSKKFISRSLSSILLLIVVLVVFVTIRFFFPPTKGDLTQLLPEDTEMYAEINTHQLLKTVLSDFLAQKESLDIDFNQFKSRFENQEKELPGADFQNGMVLFRDKWDGISVQGVIFHIKSHRTISSYVPEEKDMLLRVNKKHGILIQLPNKIGKEETVRVIKKADDIINQTTEKRKHTKEAITINYKQNSLEIYFDKEELTLKGKSSEFGKRTVKPTKTKAIVPLKQDHFDIRLKDFPDTLQHVLQKILLEGDTKIPAIENQQHIIYSSRLETSNKKLLFLPISESLIEFQEEVNLEELINEKTIPHFVQLDTVEQRLTLKNTHYYFQQLSPKEVYIGTRKYVNFMMADERPFFLSGSPAVLLNLEGDSFMARLFHIIPWVRHGQNFMDDIVKLDISVENEEVEGYIRLKDGKMFSIELLKLFLK